MDCNTDAINKNKQDYDYTIKIFPELLDSIIKAGLLKEYTLYAIMQSLNFTHSGVLFRESLIPNLKMYFKYSDYEIDNLLNSGNGIFFNLSGSKAIVIYSKWSVVRKFSDLYLSKPKIINIKGMEISDTDNIKQKLSEVTK